MAKTQNQIKGDKYEEFTAEILLDKSISWEDEKVVFDKKSSNHKLLGKSGATHQIDVHLESTEFPNYHLLCECKRRNRSVTKSEVCSFVTVINDISKNYPNWKIIGVFSSEKGFQSGAKKIASAYNITDLKIIDLSNEVYKYTLYPEPVEPTIKITDIFLSDGSKANLDDNFINAKSGDSYSAQNALELFKWYYGRGNEICSIYQYEGSFYTRKRKLRNTTGPQGKFLLARDQTKELVKMKGLIEFRHIPEEEENENNTQIFQSIKKAELTLPNGESYSYFKDNSVKKHEKLI